MKPRHNFTFRVSEEEAARLDDLAAVFGASRSETLRMLIVEFAAALESLKAQQPGEGGAE